VIRHILSSFSLSFSLEKKKKFYTNLKDKTNNKIEFFDTLHIDYYKSHNNMAETDEFNNDYECKFCKTMLSGGYDSNELMHCQGCHIIWDGNAQCPCWMLDETDEGDEDDEDDEGIDEDETRNG